MRTVLGAIAYAHDLGCMHRDIKVGGSTGAGAPGRRGAGGQALGDLLRLSSPFRSGTRLLSPTQRAPLARWASLEAACAVCAGGVGPKMRAALGAPPHHHHHAAAAPHPTPPHPTPCPPHPPSPTTAW
jgi:hypothetical protein